VPLTDPHLDRLREALKSEERFARDEDARLAQQALADRVAAGYSWAGVRLEETPSLRSRELRVLVRGTLHEGIRAGDPVLVNGRLGRCFGWDPDVAELSFERTKWDDIADAQTVDSGFDASTWIGYRKALEQADELDTPLKTALLHGPGTDQGDRDKPGDALAWEGLNPMQQAAAQAAFDAPQLAVIHGPPGTGKTRTLVALLGVLSGTRWALAESNAAVDNLALGAAAAGLHVVRVGPAHRMSGPVRDLSVQARIDDGPHAKSLQAIERDISRADGAEIRQLFDQRRELRDLARDHVLESADVIATTFGSLARQASRLPRATTAVVDEVTQAIEPAIWTAVPWVDRMILAGDPHQLGPVVLEPGNVLEVGILDRLRGLGVPMPMLTEQHRMHGDIMGLVTSVYGAHYTAHSSVASHSLADFADVAATDLTSMNAIFVDTTGVAEDERDPVSRSVFNPIESKLVAIALAELRASGVRPEQIGVVAPYSAQVARLAELPEAEGVEVATVNAFQGREAEAILMSFTRSNAEGELGFVADRRRLTVAVTRARRLLWMCGDSITLSRHSDFTELLDGVIVQSIWEPPWSAAT